MARAVPVLPTDDLTAARAFYVEGLGFRVTFDVEYDDGAGGLLGVERDGMAINLDCPMHGHGRHACVTLEVDDADALYGDWSARVRLAAPPRDEEWGARTFSVEDPSGNTLFVIGPARPR